MAIARQQRIVMQNRKIGVTAVRKPDASAMLLQQQRLVARNQIPGFPAKLLEARASLVIDEGIFKDGEIETRVSNPQRSQRPTGLESPQTGTL